MGKKQTQKAKRHLFTLWPPAHAEIVLLAGTFTGWNPVPMSRRHDGRFHISLRLEPGIHEYKFIADGQWIIDPLHSNWALNPFGSINSVLRID